MSGMLLIQGLMPALTIWLVKEVVDTVSSGVGLGNVALLVTLWAGAALVSQLVAQWVMLVQASLNERFTAHIELLLMRKANSLPDLAAFEDSTFYDSLQLLTKQAAHRPVNLMATTVNIVPNFVASISLLTLMSSLAWWLPPLLVVATLPLGYADTHLQRQSWRTVVAQNPFNKAMRYFTSISTTDSYAKDIRIFDLGAYFAERYEMAFEALHQMTSRDRARQAPGPIAAALLFVAVNAFVFWWVVQHALVGQFGPGDVVLVLQGLAALQSYLGGIAGMTALLFGHLLFFDQLFNFLAYRSPLRVASPGIRVPAPLTKGITFDVVSYCYPSGKVALDTVSFSIEPGECVALVGENGAGKTTLVKLLCRLYDPSSGSIRIDNIDLRDLNLEQWRANLGAVFQDFGHYFLTVSENIALGRLDALNDPASVERAAQASGFAVHTGELPDAYATQLGTQFGGVELSGGQWQALGIARAMVRDADILLLDEPTAALDPRAEYELFVRFRELTRGKTTLLITHRLASIQMADRILVLKQGKLVEQGTHTALLQMDGEYATLYRMQAEQFTSLITQ